jgi:hypothetical protein
MNRQNLARLTDIIDQIEFDINKIEKDSNVLANGYNYQDLERDSDLDQRIGLELKEHKLNYRLLRDKRD